MTDKMKDSIRSNMLDELLSDVDKPKAPEPQRSSFGGYGGRSQSAFDFDRGDDVPSSFRDDGPDPMDEGYRGYSRGGGTGYRAGRDSVFSRRTSHENVVPSGEKDWPKEIGQILRTARRHGGDLVLENGERQEIVELLMKIIGVSLDKSGLVWSTEGLKALRESLKDLIPMAYFGTTKILMEEDIEDVEFDPETGEIL